MKQLTAEMIVLSQELNDFFVGIAFCNQWMADLFTILRLNLPVDATQPLWLTLIEVAATTPFVPVGSGENEYIQGMSSLQSYNVKLCAGILYGHLWEVSTQLTNIEDKDGAICTNCGQIATSTGACSVRCNV